MIKQNRKEIPYRTIKPNPVNFLLLSFLKTSQFLKGLSSVRKEFGLISGKAPLLIFSPNYYQEIGEKLKRIFLVFQELFIRGFSQS